MLAVESAIGRFRRDLTVAAALRLTLLGAAVVAFAGGSFIPRLNTPVLLLAVMGAWMFLSYRSVRGSRLAAMSPLLIAAGEFDQAEQRIDEALHSFSLFRTVKLLTLHHLAMLRHAQHRWRDAADLCRELLAQRLGAVRNLSRSTRLMLADAMLELNDLPGAFNALNGLYSERLTLSEAMNLLAVQSDYLARIGAWDPLLDQLKSKLQLVELMNSPNAARTQGFMALAAKAKGDAALATFLRRRVELLIDRQELLSHRPLLAGIWEGSSDEKKNESNETNQEIDPQIDTD